MHYVLCALCAALVPNLKLCTTLLGICKGFLDFVNALAKWYI
jgi:hypothetical protein